MKIIRTNEVDPSDLSDQEREYVYNGMDCCVTAELLDVLQPQLDEATAATYDFSRQLQGPVLEMRLRGIKIDQARRAEVIEEYSDQLDRVEAQLERIVGEAFGVWQFNWRPNSRDLPGLFYDTLDIPPVMKNGRPTCDRGALEKLANYYIAKPIVERIIFLRDLMKKIGVLKTEIDKDGRMRTSYNIAGTNTGRLSSSFSEFGTGTNLQNIEESLRSVFVADPGYKLAYLDAQQGESRVVGAIEHNLFGDDRYLDACESGDLHTRVARLVWPDLAWTGKDRTDKVLAERPFYRHYSRRFMCKKIGHGTNYRGQPRTIADQAKVDIKLIKDFQPKYFAAFPAHQRWHAWVQERLYQDGYLVSLTGRKRWFLGRRDDDETLRAAIAYDPQGSLADILNYGMLETWRRKECQLLMQIHDAVLVQYPEAEEKTAIPKILEALRYPIKLAGGRRFEIPYDVATGWNWGKASKDNPDGLKEYRGTDHRRRTPEVSILDREFRDVHRVYGKHSRS
jgi:DNA polymerase-1